jgi:hypothetical protein
MLNSLFIQPVYRQNRTVFIGWWFHYSYFQSNKFWPVFIEFYRIQSVFPKIDQIRCADFFSVNTDLARAVVAWVKASNGGWSWCERRRLELTWLGLDADATRLELDADGARLDLDDGGGASGHNARRSGFTTSRGGEGIVAISTSGPVLFGNSTSSFPPLPRT